MNQLPTDIIHRTSTPSFTTECPHCHQRGDLVVIEVELVANGKRLLCQAALEPDGFCFRLPAGVKDGSTTDEVVRCLACNKEFPLTEVTL